MTTHAEHKEHILPLKVYLGVGAALMVLTAITVWVSTIPLGGWNAIVAVFIASIKASLVALFFMHLKYDNKLFMIIFLTGIIFLTLFISLTMFDVLRRGDIDAISNGPINKNSLMYEKAATSDSTLHLPDSLAVDSAATGHATEENPSH